MRWKGGVATMTRTAHLRERSGGDIGGIGRVAGHNGVNSADYATASVRIARARARMCAYVREEKERERRERRWSASTCSENRVPDSPLATSNVAADKRQVEREREREKTLADLRARVARRRNGRM